MEALSLFCGAGGMDVGFTSAGFKVVWANELDSDAVKTYIRNHPKTIIRHDDIRKVKNSIPYELVNQKIDLVFGGPPCQGFSVAGKMNPDDERNALIWEFLDVVRITSPNLFVIENVKALGQLEKWKAVRERIFIRANELGYSCFLRIINSSDYNVPQNRERAFFIGYKKEFYSSKFEIDFDTSIQNMKKPKCSLRECLLSVGKAGTLKNPLSCTAKITLAKKPVLRKSPYAGMLFNGMGRPLNLNALANTLPASMGGNKTPIIDELLLYKPHATNWIENYHERILRNNQVNNEKIPEYFRRLTINEAAAIQTFPANYEFHGEKSSIYRQIGNAVPCNLARSIAEALIIADSQNRKHS